MKLLVMGEGSAEKMGFENEDCDWGRGVSKMTPVIRAEEGSKMMLVIEIKCGFKNEGSARGRRGVRR